MWRRKTKINPNALKLKLNIWHTSTNHRVAHAYTPPTNHTEIQPNFKMVIWKLIDYTTTPRQYYYLLSTKKKYLLCIVWLLHFCLLHLNDWLSMRHIAYSSPFYVQMCVFNLEYARVSTTVCHSHAAHSTVYPSQNQSVHPFRCNSIRTHTQDTTSAASLKTFLWVIVIRDAKIKWNTKKNRYKTINMRWLARSTVSTTSTANRQSSSTNNNNNYHARTYTCEMTGARPTDLPIYTRQINTAQINTRCDGWRGTEWDIGRGRGR